ncbi:MAG TPA: TIGR04190 family B12-binding domain/radical SAM domain protein [Gemmatimonadales bacterium]|nr:TIGR04190 family B12-binding domain/radical SAM domain protein [Gemmatimonadales bacterium]
MPLAPERLASARSDHMEVLRGSRRPESFKAGLSRLFGRDLILLHPPSVYDFRKRGIMFGPISDVIPSTPVFEMYPMGLTTIAGRLEEEGFNVEIVNIAYRMLSDPGYDAEAEIAKLAPLAFGIDLHWLPHAHGGIELAKLVKKHHPGTPVIVGGLSASYYYEELLGYPWIDMVMRGDSTETPMLQLMRALRFGGTLADVPNLAWKAADGTVTVNPFSHVPSQIDDIPLPNYSYVMRSVLKYGSLANVVPFEDWLDYPITAVLTSRGCTQDCSICGGSRSAYRKICNRTRPAFRSPETLIADILRIQEFSKAPIFLVHDIRQGGKAHTERFLSLLAQAPIENELVFELFFPAGDEYLGRIARAVPRFSLEMTLETHVEALRRLNGKLACSNAEIEATIASALSNGVNRIDLFFMVGIPRQTTADVLGSVDYCRSLLERFGSDKRLWFFIAPLGPFLDPGSQAFEHPERYGYRLFCKSFEDHRQALTAPSWKHMLSFETDTMTRDDIVAATYEASARLARAKRDYGIIDAATCREVEARIATARAVMSEIDDLEQLPEGPQRDARFAAVKRRVEAMAPRDVHAKEWLKWPIRRRFATLPRLGKTVVKLLFAESYLFLFKRLRLVLGRRATAR